MTIGMRAALALILSVLAIAGVVFYASESQRRVADENYHEAIVARQLGADMLARENALNDYLQTGRPDELVLMYEADRRLDSGLEHAKGLSSDSPEELGTIAAQTAAEDSWDAVAKIAIEGKQAGDGPRGATKSAYREGLVDDFVRANRDYQRLLDEARVEELKAAALVPVKLIFALSILLGAIALTLSVRRRRTVTATRAAKAAADGAERAYSQGQARFGEAMQVAENQSEGHEILTRHLERGIPDASITVLIRNNSADRLEPALQLAQDSPLAEPLEQAKPRSCLAVRLSRPVDQGPNTSEIVTCDVCGAQPGQSTCQPLLVGGEVIGSVLTTVERTPTDPERRRIHDSVTQAAPVLANLRNLALAELRAATDALTGLPNRRAIDDHLKRLMALAGRSLTPMSAILLDLDHFKEINDTFGHERGDEVLAALGALMRSELRGSDFAGRSGGEEFIVMLPDTDRSGAMRVAEHLRQAMHSLSVPGVSRAITASFGVATYPDDALDGETLMRLQRPCVHARATRAHSSGSLQRPCGWNAGPRGESSSPGTQPARAPPQRPGQRIHSGRRDVIHTSGGRSSAPCPSASSFGSGQNRSRVPGTKYDACEPLATKITGWPLSRVTSDQPQRSAPECWE
jgi:diguanylate cyclase (GGDEF)-like protein